MLDNDNAQNDVQDPSEPYRVDQSVETENQPEPSNDEPTAEPEEVDEKPRETPAAPSGPVTVAPGVPDSARVVEETVTERETFVREPLEGENQSDES